MKSAKSTTEKSVKVSAEGYSAKKEDVMSEQEVKAPKKSNKAQAGKWTQAQARGFQFLVLALVMFWSGVYLGGLNANNYHNDIENAKASAIEESAATTSKQ